MTSQATSTVVEHLPLDQIAPENNDRTEFDNDALDELAISIQQNGLTQPITVRPNPDGGYWIVAGERRWRAHQRIGAKTIRAIVEDLSDEKAAAVMLTENLSRKDLNCIDEANAYQARIDRFGYSVEDLAEQTGKTVGVIRARLSLLKLDPAVQHALKTGGFWIAGAAEVANLTWERQRLCVNAYARHPAMTGAEWKALVKRLYADQAKDDAGGGMFDPEDLQLVDEYIAVSIDDQKPGAKHVATVMAHLLGGWTASLNAPGQSSLTPDVERLVTEVRRCCRLYDVPIESPPTWKIPGRRA